MYETGGVTDGNRATHNTWRRQTTKAQLLAAPAALAISPLPGDDLAIRLDSKDQPLVAGQTNAAVSRLGPLQDTALGIHATDAGLKSTHAQHVIQAAHRADQIDQTLNVIDAAWRGNRHFPTKTAIGRIQTGEAACKASHQRVANSQQDTGLTQHQGFGGPLLRPELAATVAVKGMNRAVSRQQKDTSARHKGGRVGLRAQLLAPDFAAFDNRHQLIVLCDNGGNPAITADTSGQRRAEVQAPNILTVAGVDGGHCAVVRSCVQVASGDAERHRKADSTQTRSPDLLHSNDRHHRLECRRFRRIGAARAGGKQRQQHTSQW